MPNGNEYLSNGSLIGKINEQLRLAGADAYIFLSPAMIENELPTEKLYICIKRNGKEAHFMLYSAKSVISMANYLKGFGALASLVSGKYNFRPMNISSYDFERKSIIQGVKADG